MASSIASLDEGGQAVEEGADRMEMIDEVEVVLSHFLANGAIQDEIAAKIAKGEQLPPEICLFCLNISSTVEENAAHMSHTHGLFMPEKEYLIDLRGLIVYLSEKIGVGNLCIYCNKSFTSPEGARAHMVSSLSLST